MDLLDFKVSSFVGIKLHCYNNPAGTHFFRINRYPNRGRKLTSEKEEKCWLPKFFRCQPSQIWHFADAWLEESATVTQKAPRRSLRAADRFETNLHHGHEHASGRRDAGDGHGLGPRAVLLMDTMSFCGDYHINYQDIRISRPWRKSSWLSLIFKIASI